MPMLEKVTGVDPNEIAIDTLAERWRTEAESVREIQMLPLMFGAWSRKPA